MSFFVVITHIVPKLSNKTTITELLRAPVDRPHSHAIQYKWRCQMRYAVSQALRKGVRPMTVFEAITLMLAFAVLIVMLLDYLKGK